MAHWGVDEELALDVALREFDRETVSRLCRQFIDHVHARQDPVDPLVGQMLLERLQRKRHFPLLQDVAEALLTHGLDVVRVRHLYALAMIDRGRTVAADAMLAALPQEVRNTNTEIRGAIGRLHKQRYLNTGPAAGQQRAADLAAAVKTYGDAYRDAPAANFYHGVNAAALLILAARDGVELDGHDRPEAEARKIADAIRLGIEAKENMSLWDCATAAEACLVLQRFDDAVVWLARYVGSNADAFEYASTLRQFQQVWRLDTTADPGSRLVPLLQNRLLQTDGGALRVRPEEYTKESLERFQAVDRTLSDRRGKDYEKVFGWSNLRPLAWLQDALVTCRSVARIEDRYGRGFGTGFVLDGAAIRPGEWPARVLLTNAHVVPDENTRRNAYVTFSGGDNEGSSAAPTQHPVGRLLWRSRPSRFDACFFELADSISPQSVALPVSEVAPNVGAENESRAYVIGHPAGLSQLQLSLHNSVVLAVSDTFVHYRSPTEPGSSGSPVFDDNWQVIALHHGVNRSVPGAADGESGANEGVRLDRLLAGVRSTASSPSP